MRTCSANFMTIGDHGDKYMLREVNTKSICSLAKSAVSERMYSFAEVLRALGACGMETTSPEAIEALRAILNE